MNHDHKHNHCKHEHLKYCAHCDKPYCLDCTKEWNLKEPQWNWYNQLYPAQRITSSGSYAVSAMGGLHSLGQSQLSDPAVTTCSHTE